MEDSEIIKLYLDRDESALDKTAEKYGSRLRDLSFHIVGERETAEECENDTYLTAWNSIPPHEPHGYFYAFLARITRNLSLSRCRERSRLKRNARIGELTREMEECIPSPDDLDCRMEELALKQAINGFLRSLSQEKRNIFVRRYWYLDSVEEISRRYGHSKSSIKTTLFRIRNGLREHLEKEGYTL